MVIGDIQNRQFFNQLRNGVDFSQNTGEYTDNLVGNVGERIKAYYEVVLSITVTGRTITQETTSNPTIGVLYADDINWREEGISEGDIIDLYHDYSKPSGFYTDWINVPVSSISEDGKFLYIDYSDPSLSYVARNTQLNDFGIEVSISNDRLVGSIFSYGIIENNEQFNTISKVTGDNQSFYAVINEVSPTTYETKGIIKGWESDILTAQISGSTAAKSRTVVINHEFILQPYYVVEQNDNLVNVIPPDNLKGDNSFKYVSRFQFRKGLSDVNSNIDVEFDSILGDVGYFGENFNGFNNQYTIESVTYQDGDTLASLDGVQILGKTKMTVEISRASGSFATADGVGAYISYLPDLDSEYINQKTSFDELFLYDGLSARLDSIDVIGSGIAKNLVASINGSGNAELVFDIDYTTAQKLRLTNENRFLFWVQIEDDTLTADSSDRVALIAGLDNYQQGNIEGLLIWNSFNILQHDQGIGGSELGLVAWNEDGLFVDFDFDLDTSKDAILQDLTFKLVAWKAADGTYFELDSYNIPIPQIFSSGIQQIEVDTTRGYILKEGDEFNFVKITTGAKVGDLQNYTGQFAQKIKWQDWLRNLNADTVFYDKNEIQDNLNFKSSNYSGLNGYEIKIIAESNLTGTDDLGRSGEGVSNTESSNIPVYDYSVSDDGVVSNAVIDLLDPDTLVSTGGQILRDKNTLFRVTWTVAAPDLTDTYVIHRIQENGSLSDNISELSSLRDRLVGDKLIPSTGNYTYLYLDSGNIVSECLIDYTKLKAGATYDLSARIKTPIGDIINYITFKFTEDTNESVILEIPDEFKFSEVTEAETFGNVTLASLTYEFDNGGGSFSSYASFALFKADLEASNGNLNRRVKISTSATGYLDGGVWLKHRTSLSISTEIDIDVQFDKNDFSHEALVYFDNKATFSSVVSSYANLDIYYKVVEGKPSGLIDYTDLTALNLTTLNSDVSATTGNYGIFFVMLPSTFYDADSISNPTLTIQGDFNGTTSKVALLSAQDDLVNSGKKTGGNCLEFNYDGDTSNGQYCKRTGFATGTGEQLDINQDWSMVFILDCYGETASGNFSDNVTFFSYNSRGKTSGGMTIFIRDGMTQITWEIIDLINPNNNNNTMSLISSLKIQRNKKNVIVINYRGSSHTPGAASNVDNVDFFINGVLDENPSLGFTGNFASGAINSQNELFVGTQTDDNGGAWLNLVNRWFQGKLRRILRGSSPFTPLEVREINNTLEWPSAYASKLNDWDFDQASGNVPDSINSKDITPTGLGAASAPSYVTFY